MKRIITSRAHSRGRHPAAGAQAGLTLVELVIVITIIGLIIGGVAQGQALIDNAKRQAVMREVDNFRAPVFAFQDKYQMLPGDMLDATARELLGVKGGDGNGVVGGLYSEIYGSVSANSGKANENRMFWNHLAAAGMMQNLRSYSGGGVDQLSNMRFGKMFPQSRIEGAGYTAFRYTANEGTNAARTAYWVRLHRQATGEAQGALSPDMVQTLDSKFDDGSANDGSIRAGEDNVAEAATCLDAATENGYNLDTDSDACIVIFELL